MACVNLFIIGVNKAGTSWLYYFLSRHPEVYMSSVKELNFFTAESSTTSTLEQYHSHFPFEKEYKYYGEATPMYYRDPAIADAIYHYNPEAKLLAIVRDPIQRLLSQYRYHKQLGILEEETSLDEALDGRDPKLIQDSHYEKTLPAFTEQFGPEQFKIVHLENARNAPEWMWNELLSYLNLPPAPCPDPDSKPKNPTGSAAFRRLYRVTVRPIKTRAPRLFEWMLQSDFFQEAKQILIQLLGTAESTALSDEQEARLRREFAPTYEYLQSKDFERHAMLKD